MTLPERIKLMEDMIRENREVRICDYLEAMAEVDQIELTKSKAMNKPKKYTVDDALFMMRHAEDYDVRQIAEKLNLTIEDVYNFGSRNKLTFKPVTAPKKREEPKHLQSVRADAPKVPIIRAAANYDNLKTNYI